MQEIKQLLDKIEKANHSDGTVSLKLGKVWVHFNPKYNYCHTIFEDGVSLDATPQDTESYLSTAQSLGYEQETALMCYHHELFHSLLAYLRGLDYSPVLWIVAHNELQDGSYLIKAMVEEEEVMAFQAYFQTGRECNQLYAVPEFKFVKNYLLEHNLL